MHTRTNKQPYPQNADIPQLPRRPFIITKGVCREDSSLLAAGGGDRFWQWFGNGSSGNASAIDLKREFFQNNTRANNPVCTFSNFVLIFF